jgi:hypothetical protein
MISAYQAIFSTMIPISCVLTVLITLSLVLEKGALTARSILFSFQFWIAPVFLLTYMVVSQHVTEMIVLAACLEILFLAVYRVLFARLFRLVTSASPGSLSRMLAYLRYGTWAIIILAFPLYLQGGVGIFSAGSRNDIVAGSRLNLYFVYASALIQASMIPVVAAIINADRRWRGAVVFYLLLVSILSILSGSKGLAILTLLSVVSLLKFDRPGDYFRLLRVPLLAILTVFSLTVYFVGRFSSLEPANFISLMAARVFLANDCRALAIDWSTFLGTGYSSLFEESFRFYATLLGSPPTYPPLGQLLYSIQFNTEGMVGANTSSTALLIAYGGEFEKILFSIVLAGLAVGIGLLAATPGRWVMLRFAIGITLLSLLSQDFLAFQVTVHTLVILSAGLLAKAIITSVLQSACQSVTSVHRSTLVSSQ